MLALDFEAEEREQTAKITIGRGAKERTAQLNGVDQPAASSLIGKFCAVVFSPDHLSLVKEGPSMRRKFLDAALCQRKPAYARLLSQYSRTLAQRNTLLKDISYHSELLETLEIWDEKLSGLGAAITIERKRYLERLSEAAGEIYDGISQGRERFAVRYDSGLLRDGGEEAGYRERLFSLLQNGRKEDLNAGFTTKGPHRDDLLVTVQEKSAREYGSQGQQRSCVLALKLAEAALAGGSSGGKAGDSAGRRDERAGRLPPGLPAEQNSGLAGVYHLLRSQLHFGLVPGQNLLRRKRRDPGVTGPWKSKKTAGAFGQRLEGR